MAMRLELYSLVPDGRAAALAARHRGLSVTLADVVTLDRVALEAGRLRALVAALSHPLRHATRLPGQPLPAQLPPFTLAIEVGYLPGVTDTTAATVAEILAGLDPHHNRAPAGGAESGVHSSLLWLLGGDLPATQALVAELHNPLIQRVTVLDHGAFMAAGGMPVVVPRVSLTPPRDAVTRLSLMMRDEELEALGRHGIPDRAPDGTVTRRGPLGLALSDLMAIRGYYERERRDPSDVELECLAQTWSEHCKHRIFNSPVPGAPEGMFRAYIRRATETIRAARGDRDICVSVFKDNAGAIVFDQDWLIADKVETHNTPSALDPFGGAITGILGVNRDILGFGLGAKPVANRYGFCLADPDDDRTLYRQPGRQAPMLSARQIADGVIAGVQAGGNESGIPTLLGFVYTEPRYRGKPLVFAGTIGLIPRQSAGRPAHDKGARPGDLIVMVGGRVGRDGIHGATFSSEALTSGSPVSAVQIGDSLTQKRLSDALIGEARDRGLYTAITDNGAGGLSSSVGEMAETPGGAEVDLDLVPLKYPGLAPWQIWISESQERMTLAVPREHWEPLCRLLEARGVEATVIGRFTDTGRLVLRWQGAVVGDLDLEFLHRGAPDKALSEAPPPRATLRPAARPQAPGAILPALLARPAMGSRESLARRFDHEVQGGTVLKPIQGIGRVSADVAAFCPVPGSDRAVVLSQGLAPRISDVDCYAMAAASIDFAVRAAIAAGAPPDHLAILDNFCWCSADQPERVAQLHAAARACHDVAVALGTPYISGKDSMFNDFRGFGPDGEALVVSIPPTLLVSAIGVAPDWRRLVSLDPKAPGDRVYLLGRTGNHLGGSEAEALIDAAGGTPPAFDPACAAAYLALAQAISRGWVASAVPVGLGGLAVAAARAALAGGLGLRLDLTPLAQAGVDGMAALYGESLGRVLLTVAAADAAALEALCEGQTLTPVGEVTHGRSLSLRTPDGVTLVWDLATLDQAYRAADHWA